MKFITFNIFEKTNLLILAIVSCIIFSGISCANLNQNNQSIPSIMERISAGDLTEKEITEIYTKNYKPELEYHEIFQSCISHLYTQKKKTNSSVLSKIFFGFEKIVSNPNKLQIPDMGLKVDCEVYLNRILSNDYRDKKINEKNPLSEKIDELKTKIQNLSERYDNLAVQSLLQRSENKIKKSEEEKGIKTTTTTRRIISGGSNQGILSGGSSSSTGSSSSSSSTGTINGGSSNTSTSTRTITGGSTSSTTKTITGGSTSSTTTTTLDINSDVPTYITTDGEVDINSFNSMISQLKAQSRSDSEKYSSLEIQYQKVLSDYNSLKTEFSTGKDQECDCNSKLKTCEQNLNSKDIEITRLTNIIFDLKSKITICETNPAKGDCKDLTLKLKEQIEINNKCQKEKVEITNKWTILKTEITTITTKYDTLKIKYDLLIKEHETCKANINIFETKIITINKKCEDNTSGLKIEIQKLTLEINLCKKDLAKCKLECQKKPDTGGDDNGDILIKHKYDQCIIRESHLHITINVKDTRITNLINELAKRDQEIIDIRSKITILEINIKNCKDDNEKTIKELQGEIHILNITIKTCEAERSTLIIYKTKYEKCNKNCQDQITILNTKITMLTFKITTITAQLKDCKRSESTCKIDISKYITIINKLKVDIGKCSDKEKNCTTQINIKKIEITNIIEENKTTIINIQNTLNKKCEEEKKTLVIKITLIQKQLDECNKKKDLEIDVKKCEDKNKDLNILIVQKTTIINKLTIEINTCTKELDSCNKTNIININNIKIINIKIDTCNKDLKICKDKGPKICDDTKYDILLKKYETLNITYETTNHNWYICKNENSKLLIELDFYKNKKCDENCDGKLKTCETNITTITNNYNTKIEMKITLINQLNIRINQLEKECKNDYIDIQLKLKTCESSKIDIKNRYDLCQFDLKNETSLRITYYKELIFIKKEFKNCSKQAICKEDEINMFKRVAEKCEENKITITKHLDSLKEKFGKLHRDKTSFYSETNTLITDLSKKCSVDTSALLKFMSTFDINVTELNNFREGIIADIKKDDIEKNKNEGIIQLKREEITRTKTSITQINVEITKIVKSTETLIDKLKTTTTLALVKQIITQLEENELNLKNKNTLLISYIERVNKSESELNVLLGLIKNAETLKIFRNSKYGQVKNISTNVEKSQVEIRRFIDVKTTLSKTVDTKIINYKKSDIAQNPLIAILKGEKDIINNNINNYKERNMQLEKKIIELKTKLTLIEGKSNKDEIISKSFEDGSVMKLFQNTDLVLKNCGQIKDFTSKLTDICKNQENATLNTNGTKKTSITTSTSTTTIISKRKYAKEGENCGDFKKCARGLSCLIMHISDQNRGPNGTTLKDTQPKVGTCKKDPRRNILKPSVKIAKEGEACGDDTKCATGLACLIMHISDQNRGPNGTTLQDTQPKVGTCKKDPSTTPVTPPVTPPVKTPVVEIPLDVESQEVV